MMEKKCMKQIPLAAGRLEGYCMCRCLQQLLYQAINSLKVPTGLPGLKQQLIAVYTRSHLIVWLLTPSY